MNTGNWSQNGNIGSMCLYFNLKANQIIIMDNKQFYDVYPELNKHNNKKLEFKVSTRRDTVATTEEKLIGYYKTIEEALSIANDIMMKFPNGLNNEN